MHSKEIIFYTQGLRYELSLTEDKGVLIAKSEKAQVYLPQLETPIQLKMAKGQVYYLQGEATGLLEDGSRLGDLVFYLADPDQRVHDLVDKQEVLISQQAGADLLIQEPLEILLQRGEDSWQLTLLSGDFYLNHAAYVDQGQPLTLAQGDELSFGPSTIKVFPEEIWVSGPITVAAGLPERGQSRYGFYPDYPDYHRSPRIIYRSSEDRITINPPGSEPNKPSDELLKLIVPPLLMIGVTILITLIQPRGIYILATVAMSGASVIFSVQTFFKNRRKYKADKKERVDLYHLYLKDKAMELTELERKQRQGMLYHFPQVEELTQLAQGYSHRIYEKTPLHFDFLYYRLGLGQMPTSYELTYGQKERSGKKDALEEEGYALYTKHRKIPDLPIVANLSHGPVGYVGPRNLVLEQLQLLVMQLSVFRSYHDVQFITIMPEEERELWSWMRWLPHATLQEMNVRGFVYNQRTRDQVLNSLNQILKLRKANQEEKTNKEVTVHSPHYVVLVTDEKLILDHVIMEFFTEDPTRLGCSLIFVQDVMSSLSENIQTVINIKDRNTGQLVMEEGLLRETDFRLDHFPAGYDMEAISRTLAPLNHLQNLKSSIPDTVTFMEMYGAETFADLQVLKRWRENAPYKSLAVPIGLRGQDDLVYLNLHEKAHGPHGLIAGTTGSGKSETIQSYILSLAVNFHPHDVAFLLIDYKGGGMANLFKDLPHLLGTITNLDGAQSMRALASIRAEIHRRERYFAQYEVNHINQYQKKYKNGEATEPLPHLFLISDEFAELKVNQPDFIKELVSIARVGRSLGVHLILATQKPSGVVDDQIWSNSRFKLALKVADRSDSMEMLRTPDAAEITQTGRAYLQVGNNEVYELFQAAWSGADYQPDKDELGIEDHTIYLINDLGQYEVLNQDLSGLDLAEDIKEVPTELDAIVSQIQSLSASQAIPAVPQPWLPPLSERITLNDLRPADYRTAWTQTKTEVSVLLGMADIPNRQAQEAVEISLTQDGNILLYGSPGYGKTTFLQSTAMDLARNYSPADVTMYLLDFGTNGLAPLAKLPHVADTLLLDQTEKIEKFVRIMERELSRRKKLLSDYGVGTMALYREASGQEEPTIVILLDSFESMKEEPFEPELFKLLMRISREGLSIGVHLVMTAGRQANLRATLYANFKHQLTLKQNDVGEIRTIVGSTPLANTMEDIKGRVLMKRDEVEVVQLALPVEGQTDIQLIQALRQEVQTLQDAWTGHRPSAIPMVPEELTEEDFYGRPGVQAALEAGQVPLGLDVETVEAVTWNLAKGNLLYLTDKEEQMASLTQQIARTKQKVIVLAPRYHNLPEMEGVLLVSGGEVSDLLKDAKKRIQVRMEEHMQEHEATLVIYNMVELVSELSNAALENLAYVLDKGLRSGYGSVVMAGPDLSRQLDMASKIARGFKQGLLAIRISDQTLLNVTNKPLREGQLEDQVHYYVADGLGSRVKVIMQ